jgi:thiol-disulfide isomerase/thioredoxin
MRFLISVILMFFSMTSPAQTRGTTLKDDLLSGKSAVLSLYLPVLKENYLYSMYAMAPSVFIKKIKAYKFALHIQYMGERDPGLKKLKAMDADFSARLVASRYMECYGLDSMGIVRVHDMMESRNFNDKQIDSAYKSAFLKHLSIEESRLLKSIIAADADPNNDALFKRSAAYRRWLEEDGTQQHIRSPFIKAYFNYRKTLAIIKAGEDPTAVLGAYRDFMATAGVAPYKTEIEEVYTNYKRMNGNAMAPDFNYQQVDGQFITLKSLRGKYVYIDIWATWCAPCRAEVPFFKKLVQDYKQKNIHFAGISIDKLTNKSKWRNYVEAHQLMGIQLIGDNDFNSYFVKKFNVNSIPRFILIDPEGKIISGDAKKPSDPELRKQLDLLL